MSIGSFSSLPEDVFNVIWQCLDAQGLANAAQICRAFCARSNTEALWQNQAMSLLNFNTVLTPELVAAPLYHFPAWAQDTQAETRGKIVTHLKTRYQQLESAGTLAPFTVFKTSLDIKGHLKYDDLLDESAELSWKFVYKVLSNFFAYGTSKNWEIQSKAVRALFGITRRCFEQEKVTAAIKALCTVPRDYRDPSDFDLELTTTFPHASILPLIMENFLLLSDLFVFESDAGFAAWFYVWQICSHMEDPILLSWLLNHELTDYSGVPKSSDGMMYVHTHTYITRTLGPSRVFKSLVEQTGIEDLVSSYGGTEIEKMIQVAKTTNDHRVTKLTRIVCVLLIHVLEFGERLLSDVLGLDTDRVVERVVIRGIMCHPSPSVIKSRLSSLAHSPNLVGRARLLLALLMVKFGEDPNKVDLSAVPNYPRPWDGAVPLPQNVREAVLRAHRYSLAPGCDPALEVEAARLSPSPPRAKSTGTYVPDSDSEEDTTDFQFIDGVKVYGPIDCTTLSQAGGGNPGTYTVYKIFTDVEGNTNQPTSDRILYTTSLLLVCKFAPFAAVFRNDGYFSTDQQLGSMYIESKKRWERNSEGQTLPRFERALEVFLSLAATLQVTILSDELLQCKFKGLEVKLYSELGSEVPIRQLLFFWDYYFVSATAMQQKDL